MPDNIINIGAIVSTDGVQEGIATTAEAVKAGVSGMAVSFQEMSTRAQAAAAAANRAFTSISADTKAAVAGLSEQALKEAMLAKMRIAANTEVRTSIKLMTNEQFDAAKATELYAAATQKVVAIDAEIAAAQKEAAKAAAEAAEEMKLSSNVWIASMQRIALSAKESFGEMQEMMAGTVERAGLTAEGIRFGFSGLSELMGGALLVGVAGEFLDDLAKINNELDHLSVETGINITSLAGLRQMVKGMGGDFEPIGVGLTRLARAQVQAIQSTSATNQYALAFHNLGISMDEVRALSHDQAAMLNRVSQALKSSGNAALTANDAIALFGRGGAKLIPLLKEQGANLAKNMKLQGESTGITEESARAARRWSEDLARLTAEIQSDLMPVLNWMPDALRGIAGDFMGLKAVVQTVFEGIGTPIVGVVEGVVGLSRVLQDVVIGDFAAVARDSKTTKDSIVATWKGGAADITNAWKGVGEEFFGAAPKTPEIHDKLGGSDIPELPGKGGKGGKDHASQDRMHAIEEEYSELQQAHKLTLKEEHDFWEARLGEFARGTEQYRQIAAKLGTIDQSGAKQAGEMIAKFKAQSAKGGPDEHGAETGESEFQKSMRKMAEDITRTGESWKEYWSAVARGGEIEASMQASLEQTRLRILESTGGIDELASAHVIARIHTEEHARALRALGAELTALEKQAASSPKDATTGALLDGQLAGQIKNLQNQITQQKGQSASQGMQDTAAINAAMVKPYIAAFNQIDAGWKKVQTDLISGNRNIARDFAQMGVNLVQGMASHFEEILAKHAVMWIKMNVIHAAATQAGVAMDAEGATESNNISMISAIKKIGHSAAVAASKAFSAYADVPPVPVVATLMGAMAFGKVMAMAAFEQGGVVGGSPGMAVPILAHSGERVLTAGQTNNFEKLVNNNSQQGGNNTLHANVTQNFGSSSQASSAKETRATVQSLMRRGKLSYS